MSNTPTLATIVVTVRNADQLSEAVRRGSLCELRQQVRENRKAARASKTMVTGQPQERRGVLQFTCNPARRRTSTASTTPASTSASRPARLLIRGARKPPNWITRPSSPLPITSYAPNQVNVNAAERASSRYRTALLRTPLTAEP